MKTKTCMHELIDSIVFAWDSQKGKYSLETYLSIVGEYTDRLILSSEQNGYCYTGGHCKVSIPEGVTDSIQFAVEMYFADTNENRIMKKAKRILPAYKFTRETVERLNQFKELEFNIEKPER